MLLLICSSTEPCTWCCKREDSAAQEYWRPPANGVRVLRWAFKNLNPCRDNGPDSEWIQKKPSSRQHCFSGHLYPGAHIIIGAQIKNEVAGPAKPTSRTQGRSLTTVKSSRRLRNRWVGRSVVMAISMRANAWKKRDSSYTKRKFTDWWKNITCSLAIK